MRCCRSMLDGVVIATPSALHAEQCIRCFDAGAAVFCQKPLARTAGEVEAVLDAARRSDRLLGVDLSYRYTAAVEAIRKPIRSGELGKVFAADLTFHNAFGPGAGWFWDPLLSGGGCLIDLGVHLIDLALWMFDFPDVVDARAALLRDGRPVADGEVEDFAEATLALANGAQVRIACSWNLNAGRDAVIAGSFYGTEGGAAFQQRRRLVLRLYGRTVQRPGFAGARGAARRLGRPGCRRLAAKAGSGRAVRRIDQRSHRDCPNARPTLRPGLTQRLAIRALCRRVAAAPKRSSGRQRPIAGLARAFFSWWLILRLEQLGQSRHLKRRR